MSEEKKYPSLVAAAFILNKKGEVFLVRAPHWSNKLVIPGGHIEMGESAEETTVREIKEETNLDIHNIEFLKYEEIKDSKYYTKKKHLLSILFKAELKDDSQEVILDEKEGSEYFWLNLKDAIEHEDIEEHTMQAIKDFLFKKKKKGFSKKCKNCEKTDEYKTGWARAQADYQNLVKETEKNRSEWAQYSERQILEEFIPVYDNFKLAFAAERKESDEGWIKGIEYIMKQFGKVLEDRGVIEIRTVGETFDPELHEAISEEESDKEEGEILKEVAVGYKMGNKVIRPAKVVVAK
ncbi:MAG: nucleotide exchange factor GrpE [Candidatus Magasanikbacteria bacterium]|jgi:molecular chaperone GrpE|nr:nucleotide exchange factor GrpE [Candidatus Magasanikbacteria bacterium]MBT4314990.1 nucleotide exchange factor GrpE [Candidatus Magasanikbacteria bacterium]MBT4546946.1 nucleotide exchange factor GrpE [Candidatus Magasanikbacteria bacterium]MBT6819568.1 nucleotide exchange factor GrpE [Candidatus Magasanikbacteria bacterium]